jgi:tetratricopeptide (TPR) repeat protein
VDYQPGLLALAQAAGSSSKLQSWLLIIFDQTVVGGLAVVLLLLTVLLIFRLTGGASSHSSEQTDHQPGKDRPRLSADDAPELPPQQPNGARILPIRGNKPNTPTAPTPDQRISFADPVTTETTPILRDLLPTSDEVNRQEAQDPGTAAVLWERLGRWPDAARCHRAAGNIPRAAEIFLALRNSNDAIPLLEETLQRSPMKESLRLKLVEALIDAGRVPEAEALIGAVAEPNSPVPASAEFLESVGHCYESINSIDKALDYYRRALNLKPSLPELPQRVTFIKQMIRLGNTEGSKPPYPSPATEILQRYIRESHVAVEKLEDDSAAIAHLTGHEIIVGHLALGFQKSEPRVSVRSVYSLARRFSLQRQLGESKYSAVFEAVDQLLDFPVALKLQCIPDDQRQLEILKERLRCISQLNHPNLAKITFVDREGTLLRVATEYLPGGNLRDFLSRVGGVGLPLLIRMAMHLASALHSAHLKGVPHGDIRPENILIGHDQRFKLVDFALSPIPVRRIDYSKVSVSETMDTPKLSDFVVNNEGVQSDLLQMGDLLEFLLDNTRRPEGAQPVIHEATEEFRELVTRLKSGSFTSVLRLWQVLEQIFERTVPSQQQGSGGAARPGR